MMLKDYIIDSIETYVREKSKESYWKAPLVGFADANDEYFSKLKKIIGPSHLTPHEVLANSNTVVAFFIPFKDKIVESNVVGNNSSKEWALVYIETNKLIDEICKDVKEKLKQKGYDTFLIPPTHNFDEELLISNWSHKHIAFRAGLGRFGLHKMLITEKGCCGRIGSLVTSAILEPSEQINEEYCLYYHNKSCKKCIENCIFDALELENFDREKCYEICLENGEIYKDYGLADVCGKCACNIPCSSKNPIKL